MSKVSSNVIKLLDASNQARNAANFANRVQRGVDLAKTLPSKLTSYPFLGANPLSNNSLRDYLPGYLPVAALGGLAGGTFLASPVLGGLSSLGGKINPTLLKPSIDSSISLLSTGKPGLALQSLPVTKLLGLLGEEYASNPMLNTVGVAAVPILAGVAAKQAYKLYSRAGQAKRLELLKSQLG